MMAETYSSDVVHARTRNAIMAVSLRAELEGPDEGPKATRNYRAVTRAINRILSLAKDLPEDERTDKYLLQYLRTAIQGATFTKIAQLASLESNSASFDSLSHSVQTAAQVEDSNPSVRSPAAIVLENQVEDKELKVLFTDRRYGRAKQRRPRQCGDNKRENGLWRGKVMQCHDCRSIRHLKFHRDFSAEKERHEQGGCVLDGVQRQLKDGATTAQVLACLTSALNDATQDGDDESSSYPKRSDEVIDVKYYQLDKEPIEEANDQSEDELFAANFAERIGHAIEASVNNSQDFASGHASCLDACAQK